MFTGLIQKVALVKKWSAPHLEVAIDASFEDRLEIGESISVNGVCLTLTSYQKDCLFFDVSPETVSRTNLAVIKPGDSLNLERSLKIGDRLGGHWVQGHVDETGTLIESQAIQDFWKIRVQVPSDSRPYLIEKGSISIDGISLTINRILPNTEIELMIIPHTWQATNLSNKKPGEKLNLEYDILAKYSLNRHFFGEKKAS